MTWKRAALIKAEALLLPSAAGFGTNTITTSLLANATDSIVVFFLDNLAVGGFLLATATYRRELASTASRIRTVATVDRTARSTAHEKLMNRNIAQLLTLLFFCLFRRIDRDL